MFRNPKGRFRYNTSALAFCNNLVNIIAIVILRAMFAVTFDCFYNAVLS